MKRISFLVIAVILVVTAVAVGNVNKDDLTVMAGGPHLVTFMSKGEVSSSESVNHLQIVTNPGTLTELGYIFEGWDWNFSTPITDDTVIHAKWSVNRSSLSQALEHANSVNLNRFSAESASRLEDAILHGQGVLALENVTASQIAQAVSYINSAIADLERNTSWLIWLGVALASVLVAASIILVAIKLKKKRA